MSEYFFELANSKTLEKIGALTKAHDRLLGLTLDRAGALTFGLPLKDEMSDLVQEALTCVLIKRQLPSGSLKIEWSGPVWTVEEETPNVLSIGCVGWLQTLEKRVTKPDWTALIYADVDAGLIAQNVLLQSNSDSTADDVNYVSCGSTEATQMRTITLQPWGGVLSEIQDLSELESGYDFAVDPVTRELNIYRKIGVVRPGVAFEYGKNVVKARRSSDCSKICNRCIAYSSIGYAVAEDQESIREIGLFEEAISLSEVVDVSILQAFADGEVAVRSRPLRLSSFDPRKNSSARPEDPEIFRDFNVGDIVTHTVDRGRLRVLKKAHRIFGLTVAWDTTGQTQISGLQTTAS